MRPFAPIYAQAVQRKGSEAAVTASLPQPKSAAALAAESDAFYLSNLSRRVFRAGLKHAVVDAKWPAFETAFAGFNPRAVAAFSDEKLEGLATDKSIIRHFGKIRAVRANAQMVLDISAAHGSVGQFLADWPTATIVELWLYLKKHGSQLGGRSAPQFLRMVGKDTFLLSGDVVQALMREGLIDRTPTAQRDQRHVGEIFQHWQEETGRPLCQLSRILSYTAGDDYPLRTP